MRLADEEMPLLRRSDRKAANDKRQTAYQLQRTPTIGRPASVSGEQDSRDRRDALLQYLYGAQAKRGLFVWSQRLPQMRRYPQNVPHVQETDNQEN